MVKPKGGRGHRVPYRTQTMRVPVALLQQFQSEIDRYRLIVLGEDTSTDAESVTPLDKAIDRVLNDSTITRSGKTEGLSNAH